MDRYASRDRIGTAITGNEKVVLPIVGYTGHRKATKAQPTMSVGRTFREVTIESKMLEREANIAKKSDYIK